MITTIVSFIVVFGLLVFVHELGHFLTAKRAGVKIEEFAFGYPPRLFAIQRGGINYALNLIPFGGYVRMQGEDDPNAPEGLASKPRPWRALVLSAGALMNVLLAIVLFTGVYIIGEPVPTAGQVEIGEVQPGSPAAMAGLQAGDVILRLDDQEINVVNDVSTYTRSHLGTEIAMTVRRGTEPLTMRMTPRPEPPAGEGPLGVVLGFRVTATKIVRHWPWEALVLGLQRAWLVIVAIVGSIVEMIRGTAPVEIGGPIFIAGLTGQVARSGLVNLMDFTGFLSINLAIINLLPIPAVDGGRLLFLALEVLRGGRRLDPRKEGLINLVGLLALLGLLVVISYFDILRAMSGQPLLR